MDVLNPPLPQDSVRNPIGMGHKDESGSPSGLVSYSAISAKTGSNTPKKRANSKLPDLTRTPPSVSVRGVCSPKTVSFLTPLKSEAKYKIHIESPKSSPKRKRKRYVSNPNNLTSATSKTTINQNGTIIQTQSSPTTANKRKRRRSASLSINGTITSPKENKNQENIQKQGGENLSLTILKEQSSPHRKLPRTPTKRVRSISGSANHGSISHKVLTTACASPLNNPTNVPPNTTVWGWSPNRGKFKPKSIEYQNGLQIEHPEVEGAQLASSFKSKWQSVSLSIDT